MSFPFIAVYVSMIVWVFPPFRQFRSAIFYYFLILAIEDPLAIGLFYLFKINTLIVHSILSLLLYFSIDFDWEELLKNWIVNIVILAGLIIALLTLSNPLFIILIGHFLVLSKFVKYIILRLHGSGEMSIFYLVLIFYELTVLVNIIGVVGKSDIGMTLHYTTTIFQILIAIFCTIFRSYNKSLILKLKPAT